jgi:hypothetical protein
MAVLFGHGVPGEIVNGGYTNINFAFGIGVTMGMLCGGQDLRRTFKSRRDAGSCGLSRIPLAQVFRIP